MAFLSLIPAVGATLVWLPVAIYFLATGAIWQGIGLILYGVLVIGLVDNLLRPFLVGKGTKLPDYVVLISTLGGIEVFGLNGFVIGPLIAAMFMVSWEIFSASRGAVQEAPQRSRSHAQQFRRCGASLWSCLEARAEWTTLPPRLGAAFSAR